MRIGRRTVAAVAAVVLLAITGTALWIATRPEAPDPVEQSAPVPLDGRGVPEQLLIGVVITLASDPGEGAEWQDAAEGAQVAAHRFRAGGADVRIVAADDQGTPQGAHQAVQELAAQGVAGVVIATSGSHTSGAVEAANALGMAALLPYASDPSLAAGTARLTGADDERIAAAVQERLEGAGPVLLIDAGGGPAVSEPAATLSFAAGADAAALAREAAAVIASEQPETIVVSGPALAQAQAVQALQSIGAQQRILLTPQAQSPLFGAALDEAGGTLASSLSTVGPAHHGDAVALHADRHGRAMSSFLAGVRALADDEQATTLFGDRAFAEAAWAADALSHDAVVALVRAAGRAGATGPAEVSAALATLELGPGSGLAGPELAFTSNIALAAPLVPLHSTAQDLGLRPAREDGTGALLWFADTPGGTA